MLNLNLTNFPELKTENIILRRLTENDSKSILAIRSDKELSMFLDRPICNSLEEAVHFITKINSGIDKNGVLYWGISINNNPQVIGTICLWNIQLENYSADIGFELLTEFQGKGIMQQAVLKVIDYAFKEIGFKKILGEVDPNNTKSIKLMSKVGFIFDVEETSKNGNIKTVIYSLSN